MILSRTTFFLAIAGITLAAAAPASARQNNPPAGWNENQLIEPAALVSKLRAPLRDRPVVLQVGFRVLYEGAHIPGAIYAGPASTREGLELLKQTAARIPRDRQVVIYCGCCPMDRCPNVHPAYDALAKMGFRNLRVLDLPQDFEHDWVANRYPVVRPAEAQH
jgi:thiosulfate/3-mercaptopyruvate sulfurtransferase